MRCELGTCKQQRHDCCIDDNKRIYIAAHTAFWLKPVALIRPAWANLRAATE